MNENIAANDEDRDSDKGGVKSLRKALALLEAVGSSLRPVSPSEVALAVGISRPTAYRIIGTLVDEGYLVQNPESGRLTVGYSTLQIAASILDSNRLRLESLPHLQDLSKLTGERTNLGIIHRNQVLYLAGVEKPSLPTIYTRFGKTAPVHCCSLGKAILSHLPEDEMLQIVNAAPLHAQTPNSITSMTRFREELDATRQRRFATDIEEHMINSSCIAAPIFSNGRAIAAIGISSSSDKFESIKKHIDELIYTAEIISHKIKDFGQ
ncbi:MAG: IclR family transcriptional regulator [Rhizobiaceae bacterium]|nr:IclR family transcriptional regulator [Rhizobiaceae bacterium]